MCHINSNVATMTIHMHFCCDGAPSNSLYFLVFWCVCVLFLFEGEVGFSVSFDKLSAHEDANNCLDSVDLF